MTDDSKMLFVVGCPRSGTSIIAKALVESGLQTAVDNRRNQQYISGYYEYLPLLIFHKGLEKLPRSSDYRITKEPYLKSEDLDDTFIREMFDLATFQIKNREVDFIKFPQLALSIDFLFEEFENIHILGVWRNPENVFRSLILKEFPRDMIPASGIRAIYLQSIYAYHLLEAHKKYNQRVTIVSIDDLHAEKWKIKSLLGFLGFKADADVALRDVLDKAIWTTKAAIPWKIYFHLMKWLVFLVSRLDRATLRDLGDLQAFQQKIQEIIDENSFTIS